MTLEEVCIHKVQDAVEQHRYRPVVSCQIFQLSGKILVTAGLIEVVLNGHSRRSPQPQGKEIGR